ncbi:MAG: molybdopterin-dependent oxidoreductase [Candidatus Sumerlaeia bacterium]|nr:molybdopterin-dependent oxidoreductase [Candidatus Sumerlaeia bacterium]
MTRRKFLKWSLGGAVVAVGSLQLGYALDGLQPAVGVENPLLSYPNRDWEKVYRNIFQPDQSYYFMCTPNCTHNCLLRAEVKNGVVVRVGPSMRYHEATDLYGTKASQRWDPRICNKGTILPRRIHGDRRVKHPMVRKGYKQWVEQGFPRDANGLPPAEMFRRGEDEYIEVTWEEAFALAAKGLHETARRYSGKEGAAMLTRQGYDEAMVAKAGGAGTRCMKFRGGMPALGPIKLFGLYRMANMMALVDANVRGVGPDAARGGIGFDNYSWHTDLPPGHPMVTGQQTVDFDLSNTEYCDVVICWGMNWLCTKMPDSHWLTEAKLKGKRVIAIMTDYNATAAKAHEVVIVRPGTDPALALGMAQVIIAEKLYDEDFVKSFTDLPLLVRTDTGTLVRAGDVLPGYTNKTLERTEVASTRGDLPPAYKVDREFGAVTAELREKWGDLLMWDKRTNAPVAVNRDEVGKYFPGDTIDPALEGEFTVTIDGESVAVRTVFSLVRQHLDDTWTPEATSRVTWAPVSAIRSLARQCAAHPERVLFATGMGPNQMFNADLKDRAIFLVAALTRNVGFPGGNVGSYAGNYRSAYFNGIPQYVGENPFDINLDPDTPARVRTFFSMQSAHFYSHCDRPLRVHGRNFTGDTHMPTPTKSLWFAGSNSLLGNSKGHFDVVMNLLRHPDYRAKSEYGRMIECVFVNEWWWSGSCEYADIVFAIDSWAEYRQHDVTQSCTNPFMQVMPLGEIPRIHNTRSNAEVYKGVAQELARLTGDTRCADYWAFISDTHRAKPYIQRILDHCNMFKGYRVDDLVEQCKQGIPAMMMGPTYPKYIGHRQSIESRPWYTRTGRLEFYRDEKEFLEHGENLPVYREPVDSTFYEPNAIVAQPHPSIHPTTPEQYGFDSADMSGDTLQVRNVVRTVDELMLTKHPMMGQGYTHIWLTPKYRHAVHTFGVDIDFMSLHFGPFGDMYRHDKRKPWVGEGYVEMNPHDARELGLDDGDYVWIDGNPETLPFRGWQERPEEYKVARCMLRLRYFPGIPRGVTRTWFNMYMASFGTVKAQATRADGLARSAATGYQSMYRFGGHQSGTRTWLRPTLLTDTLVRKDYLGQIISTGFSPDVHCANGAPRESFVKFTKAEDGAPEGGLWPRARQGMRPGYETETVRKYIAGSFVS